MIERCNCCDSCAVRAAELRRQQAASNDFEAGRLEGYRTGFADGTTHARQVKIIAKPEVQIRCYCRRLECDAIFTPKRPHQRYCSATCADRDKVAERAAARLETSSAKRRVEELAERRHREGIAVGKQLAQAEAARKLASALEDAEKRLQAAVTAARKEGYETGFKKGQPVKPFSMLGGTVARKPYDGTKTKVELSSGVTSPGALNGAV